MLQTLSPLLTLPGPTWFPNTGSPRPGQAGCLWGRRTLVSPGQKETEVSLNVGSPRPRERVVGKWTTGMSHGITGIKDKT